MSDYAIQIENLSKRYQISRRFKLSIKEKIKSFFQASKNNDVFVTALNEVNFNVKKGEVLGIIGDNGSGKSTLLKLISGITEPTSGNIKVTGRVASILEIGIGFHPELTGRENIYFGGSILGLSRKEVASIIGDIIEFSELNDFIDAQVKFYSSGMFMRLAFALVVHVNADIILLDEIISVGDADFRKKCEVRIESLYKSGKTILFVSHELNSVIKMCSKFLILKNGSITKYSKSLDTLFEYLSDQDTQHSTPRKFEIEKEASPLENIKDEKKIEETIKDEPKEALPKKTEITITNFDNEYVGPNLSVRCFTLGNKKLDSLNDVFIECKYTQTTNSLMFPNFELSYQMTTRLAALNPFYSKLSNLTEYFSNEGSKVVRCKIPKLMLNNGVFGLRLFFVNEKSEPIGVVNESLYFTVGFSNEILKTRYYDGKFTGGFAPQLEWEIERK